MAAFEVAGEVTEHAKHVLRHPAAESPYSNLNM